MSRRPSVVAWLAWLSLTGCARSSGSVGGIPEQSVTLQSGDVTLSGTLVRPRAIGRTPGVVLLHGSGPQLRDLDTARWFASQGVTALAYDKRGVGESTGDFRAVPFMELAQDGLAAVHWLRQRPDVDASRVGVWGLSQGGWLGPLAASESQDIAFVIAVSGPGVSPGDQMVFFDANRLRDAGVAESTVREITALRRVVWDGAFERRNLSGARAQVERLRQRVSNPAATAQLDELASFIAHPDSLWIRQEMRYDPVIALARLAVPSLFIFGDEDELVPVPESVAVIRRTLVGAHQSDFSIKVIAGADHGMNNRAAADYLATMADWLSSHVTHRR